MADPYIDQFETLVYGSFSCDQMATVCVGRIPELDATVQFAIASQKKADSEMKAVLDRQPKTAHVVDPAAVLETARDGIVRFGSYLDSLKGRPIDPRRFFRNDVPSVIARRRLTKLSAAIGHIVEELPRHDADIKDKTWVADFADIHAKLVLLEKQQRSTKVEKVDVGPEVAAARLRWLDTYNANKLLIRGLLAHLGKPELLPLIFDDLAEFHRVAGVSDEPEPTPTGAGATPTGTGATPPAPATTPPAVPPPPPAATPPVATPPVATPPVTKP